jgi:hypothetical protein
MSGESALARDIEEWLDDGHGDSDEYEVDAYALIAMLHKRGWKFHKPDGPENTQDLDVRIQWHQPNAMFVAVLLRNGVPWYLDGALVGMGTTRDRAVEDLYEVANYLVIEGENAMTMGPISREDREWLFKLLDKGNDVHIMQARYEKMRAAGMETG